MSINMNGYREYRECGINTRWNFIPLYRRMKIVGKINTTRNHMISDISLADDWERERSLKGQGWETGEQETVTDYGCDENRRLLFRMGKRTKKGWGRGEQ